MTWLFRQNPKASSTTSDSNVLPLLVDRSNFYETGDQHFQSTPMEHLSKCRTKESAKKEKKLKRRKLQWRPKPTSSSQTKNQRNTDVHQGNSTSVRLSPLPDIAGQDQTQNSERNIFSNDEGDFHTFHSTRTMIKSNVKECLTIDSEAILSDLASHCDKKSSSTPGRARIDKNLHMLKYDEEDEVNDQIFHILRGPFYNDNRNTPTNEEADMRNRRADAVPEQSRKEDDNIDNNYNARVSPFRIGRKANHDLVEDKYAQDMLKQDEHGMVRIPEEQVSKQPVRGINAHECNLIDAEHNLKAIHAMAEEHLKYNEYDEALEVYEEILRGQQERYGKEHLRVGTVMHNLGLIHLLANDHQKAVDTFRNAAKVRKKALGKDHQDVAETLTQLGMSCLETNQLESALIAFKEALRIRRFGNELPKISQLLNNIGCILFELNHLRQAIKTFEEALEIQHFISRSNPMADQVLLSIASTQCNVASIRLRWEHFDEASVVLDEALLIQQSVLGDDHETVLNTLNCMELVDRNKKACEERTLNITETTTTESSLFSDYSPESTIGHQGCLTFNELDLNIL